MYTFRQPIACRIDIKLDTELFLDFMEAVR